MACVQPEATSGIRLAEPPSESAGAGRARRLVDAAGEWDTAAPPGGEPARAFGSEPGGDTAVLVVRLPLPSERAR